VPECQK